jgi:hypothetical protein
LLKKLNIHLPYDPAILLLGIYPKECDSGYHKGNMFTATLSTIAKIRKQPRCPTTNKQIKKMWYFKIKAKAHKGGVRIGKTPKKLASICCP